MKSDQLKKVLMPIIRECIHEILSEPQVAESLVREGMQRISNPKVTQTITAAKPAATKENLYKEYVQRAVSNKVENSVKRDFLKESNPAVKRSMLDEMLEGVEDIGSRDQNAIHQVRESELEDMPGSNNWAEIMKRL